MPGSLTTLHDIIKLVSFIYLLGSSMIIIIINATRIRVSTTATTVIYKLRPPLLYYFNYHFCRSTCTAIPNSILLQIIYSASFLELISDSENTCRLTLSHNSHQLIVAPRNQYFLHIKISYTQPVDFLKVRGRDGDAERQTLTQRHIHRDTDTEIQTQRYRHRDTDTEIKTQTYRHRDTDTATGTDRHRETDTEILTQRDTDTERQTERGCDYHCSNPQRIRFQCRPQ